MAKNVLVIVQARMGSTRFPGKVMSLLNGVPLIEFQLERIKKSNRASNIVVAISDDSTDDQLATFLSEKKQVYVRGSLENVLARFLKVIELYNPEIVVRITGDCPLVMPEMIDELIDMLQTSNADYATNAISGSYPDGLDVEVFYSRVLLEVNGLPLTSAEREHVTLGIYTRPEIFKILSIDYPLNLNELRLTVDYPEDLAFLQRIIKCSEKENADLTLTDILSILSAHPELTSKVSHTMRNIAIRDWQATSDES
jgi:spore coat polysaccharide biosynthesis protein SpsF